MSPHPQSPSRRAGRNPDDNPQWWVLDAACYPDDGPPVPIDELFVDAGKTISPETYETCRTCPVRVQCLQWAYTQNIKIGYFGGVSSGIRRRHRLDELTAMIEADQI